MNDMVNKLKDCELAMAEEKGSFDLFALFLREDVLGKWDLVVAAGWAEMDKGKSFPYIAGKVQAALSNEELLRISRIVILDKNNPALLSMHKAFDVEHGISEIHDCNFSGVQIKHAYLITSRRRRKGRSGK